MSFFREEQELRRLVVGTAWHLADAGGGSCCGEAVLPAPR